MSDKIINILLGTNTNYTLNISKLHIYSRPKGQKLPAKLTVLCPCFPGLYPWRELQRDRRKLCEHLQRITWLETSTVRESLSPTPARRSELQGSYEVKNRCKQAEEMRCFKFTRGSLFAEQALRLLVLEFLPILHGPPLVRRVVLEAMLLVFGLEVNHRPSFIWQKR